MKRKYAAIVLGVAITCTTAQAVTAEPGSQNQSFAIEQNQASGQNGIPQGGPQGQMLTSM